VRQVALEVLGVALTILRMMQHGVDIMEDIPFGDCGAILRLELHEGPISDVLSAIGAIGGVGVVGEALRICSTTNYMQIRNNIST